MCAIAHAQAIEGMGQFMKRLGVFRTLPVFFVAGAGIEWFMIHVQVGKETFCK